MTGREYFKDVFKIDDPENYVVINFASDSIKKDAKILQISYVHKGEMTVQYIKGGNPRLNGEFTGISARVYEDEALGAGAIEGDFIEFLKDEEIAYIVYNNEVWNKRLLENNSWTRVLMMAARLPCLAISDYEVVRRAFGDTILDHPDLKKACSTINTRAKSAPKGVRCTIYNNYFDRHPGAKIPSSFSTESEKLAYAMDKIMQSILNSNMNEETYKV